MALLLAVLALAVSSVSASAQNVYVVTSKSNSISIINSLTNKVVGPPIPVGSAPVEIAITPDGSHAYVTNNESDSVSVIDTQSGEVVGPPIAVGARPSAIAITADGKSVYVTNFGSNDVSVIDTATNQTVGTRIKVGGSPNGIAITPDGTRVYVTNLGSKSVSIIDTGSRQEIVGSPITVGELPASIAIAPDGRSAFVTGNPLSVIDIQANQVVSTISAQRGSGIAITPDGERAYVTNSDSGSVSVIDTQRREVVGSPIVLGTEFPRNIAITPDGKTAYVTNLESRSVSAIDTQTNQVFGSPISVGEGPIGLAIAPVDLPPIATFSTRSVARLGAPIAFNASASSDADGTVANFAWSFGDGAKASSAEPALQHTFTRPGTYSATLAVTDNEGCATGRVLSGQTVSCYGSPLAMQSKSVKVVYPAVLVKCPSAAKAKRCKFAVQGLTKKHKGQVETQIAKAVAKAGKSVLVPLKPKKKFIKKLGTTKLVLIKETIRAGNSANTRFRRVLIRIAVKK